MDQVEELLAAIADAKVAAKAEILPDEPARKALWLAQELPKWTWSWLRRIVQDTRESFLPGVKRRRKGEKGRGTDWQSVGDSAATEFRRQGMLGVQPWPIYNDTNKRVRPNFLSLDGANLPVARELSGFPARLLFVL
jgi:hypothetical protein